MGNALKVAIERALQPLLGLPLSDMWRISRFGLQRVEFGEQRASQNRRGEAVAYGSCFLHVACAWRIVTAGAIVIGADDYNGRQRHEPFPSRLDPDNSELDAFAQRTSAFFDSLHNNPPVVEAIEADPIGSVRFFLSEAGRLEILPLESGPEEHWRLLYRDKRKRQFVVTGQGIEGHNSKAHT
jgi:hypothetical protein